MATTDTNLPQLVINVGTQAQIEAAIQAGTITADMLSITTDGAGYAEQLSSLPAASSSLEGVIYQYIGSTGGGYTKGCFYECVDDSGTYYWKEVLALPDQTGNNGKFLKTDGDTVSWAQGVENYGPQTQDLIIGNSAHTKNTNINYATAVGGNAYAKDHYATAIGYNSTANYMGIAIGYGASNSSTNGYYSVAIGNNAVSTAGGNFQFGNGTNSESGTVCFSLSPTGSTSTMVNYKLLDSDGTIPEARLASTSSASSGYVLTLDSNLDAVWAAGGGGGSIETFTASEVQTIWNSVTPNYA